MSLTVPYNHILIMIPGWTTLTSQQRHPNYLIRLPFRQIRASKKKVVVRPVFQICLLISSQTRDLTSKPIDLHYLKNVWSTRCSNLVIVCAFRSKNCGPAGFQTILKTGRTITIFDALIWQKGSLIR